MQLAGEPSQPCFPHGHKRMNFQLPKHVPWHCCAQRLVLHRHSGRGEERKRWGRTEESPFPGILPSWDDTQQPWHWSWTDFCCFWRKFRMQSACEGMLGINTCSRGGTLNQTTDTLPTQKSTFLKENLSHIYTPCRSLQGLAGNAEQAATKIS